MNPAEYSLLTQFRRLFEGQPYLHRNSSQGDKAVRYLYEDLRRLNKSALLTERIDAKTSVLTQQIRRLALQAAGATVLLGSWFPWR